MHLNDLISNVFVGALVRTEFAGPIHGG